MTGLGGGPSLPSIRFCGLTDVKNLRIRGRLSLVREQGKEMKKTYGITLKTRPGKQRPVPMTLSKEEGSRVVLSAAKRVITTHSHVIKALAKR